MPDQARTKKRKEKGKEKTRSEDDVLMDKAGIEEERKKKKRTREWKLKARLADMLSKAQSTNMQEWETTL